MIQPDRTVVSRVIVRAPNWLGDAVMALPAMVALRRHFAAARLVVAAPAGVAPIFTLDTGVAPDEVLTVERAHRAAIAQLQRTQADLIVLLPNSFRTAWQAHRAGIPQRWGYAISARGWLLTRRARRVRPGRRDAGRAPQHHVDYYRDLVRGLGIPVDEDPPRLSAGAAHVATARARLARDGRASDRYVLLAPGAAYGQAKQWPPARVAELIARLARDRDLDAVLVGAGHDRDAGRTIERWLAEHAPDACARLINLIGHTDLLTLAALAEGCRVAVTNDSGAMHVVAATGRPVIALFGPTDERVTRPLGRGDVLTADVFCRPCHLRDCPIDHRCMKRLTVDHVFAAVSRHLAFTGSRP